MASHPYWWSTVTNCFWRPHHVISIATSGLVMDTVKLFPKTVGQDSKVLLPVSTPAKSGGDFTTQAVQDTLFCFVKKKIISTVKGCGWDAAAGRGDHMGMAVLLAPVLRCVCFLTVHDVEMLQCLLYLFLKRLYTQTIKIRILSTFWSLSIT